MFVERQMILQVYPHVSLFYYPASDATRKLFANRRLNMILAANANAKDKCTEGLINLLDLPNYPKDHYTGRSSINYM